MTARVAGAGTGVARACAPVATGRAGDRLIAGAFVLALVATVIPLALPIGGIYVTSIDGPLLLLLGLATVAWRPTAAPAAPARAIDTLDGLLVAAFWLAAIATVYSFHHRNSANDLADLARFALVYPIAVAAVARGQLGFRLIARTMAVLWAIEVAVGIAQYTTVSLIGSSTIYFGDPDPGESLFEFDDEVGYSAIQRVSGTGDNGPDYACWVVLFATVMSADIMAARLPPLARLLLMGLVHGLTALVVGLSLSRGIVLFHLITLAVLLGTWGRRQPRNAALLLCGLGFLGIMGLLLLAPWEASSSLASPAILKRGFEDQERGHLAWMAWQLLYDPRTWIVGVGMGAVFPAAHSHGLDLSQLIFIDKIDPANHPSGTHNFFIDAVVENGLAYGVIVVAILALVIVRCHRAHAAAISTAAQTLAAALLAFWLGSLIPLLHMNDYLSQRTIVPLALLLALVRRFEPSSAHLLPTFLTSRRNGSGARP